MSHYNIPLILEQQLRGRDKKCVYCGKIFENDATIEHINNDAADISLENLAIACNACNASKGTKTLTIWLKSDYCRSKKIRFDTVADVIKNALQKDL